MTEEEELDVVVAAIALGSVVTTGNGIPPGSVGVGLSSTGNIISGLGFRLSL